MFARTAVGNKKYKIVIRVFSTDNGFIIHIMGGEKTHIGAVILSIPHQSLIGDGSISCNTSVLPLTGHKNK